VLGRIGSAIGQSIPLVCQDWAKAAYRFFSNDRVSEEHPVEFLQMTLPETITTGVAVSRDRYCRWENQDMELEKARAYCTEMNKRAVALFGRIAKSRHMTPGGNN
jgi:hypothetical protein